MSSSIRPKLEPRVDLTEAVLAAGRRAARAEAALLRARLVAKEELKEELKEEVKEEPESDDCKVRSNSIPSVQLAVECTWIGGKLRFLL